jgi:hypothetical protein
MVKKNVLVFVFMAIVGNGVFAQFSMGAGGYITSDFGGGVEASVYGIKAGSLKTPYFGGGAFVFADAKFIELNLGFFGFGGEWEDYGYGVGTYTYDISGSGVDIGLLGKYPFTIRNRLLVFPLLGITYRAIVSAELDDIEADDPSDLNALWFKFGGGLDHSFTDKIYLRGEALYGVRLSNEFEDDLSDLLKTIGPEVNTEKLVGHGLEIKLALGYRF